MDELIKRFILFLFICIPLRFLISYGVKKIPLDKLPYLGLLGLFPVIGFTIIYLFKLRKVGPETFGKPIWWNGLRPIHAILYLCFVVMAVQKHRDSWKPLFIDAVVGLNAFIINHSAILL